MAKEIHKLFFQMERKHHLFDLRTKDNLPIWDIVRYIVYYKLVFQNYRNVKPTSRSSKVVLFFSKILFALRSLISFRRLFISRTPNFQFGVSRVKNLQGKYYDPYYDSISDLIDDKCILYESVIDKKEYSKAIRIYDLLPLLKNVLKLYHPFANDFKAKNGASPTKIMQALNDSFSIKVIDESEIEGMINDFRLEYAYYKWFLKTKEIKNVFLTQNGIQKALISAAKNSKIPTYEFQHGDIVDSTILYNYHFPEFNRGSNIIYPDVLFTFSNLWTKNKYIPSECIEIGTKFFNTERIDASENDSIVFIASNEQNEELQEFAVELAKSNEKLKIYYKLHPAQFHLKGNQKKYFANFSNITVIGSELNVSQMMSKSDHFLAIYSTVIFEALQAGKFIYILKRQNYLSFECYFDLPQVELVNTASEVIKYFEQNSQKNLIDVNTPKFFKPFSAKAFLSSIRLQGDKYST